MAAMETMRLGNGIQRLCCAEDAPREVGCSSDSPFDLQSRRNKRLTHGIKKPHSVDEVAF